MIVNFDITDNFALNYEGRDVDLQNNFDFVGFDYNVAERQVKLSWKKSSGHWVDKNEISSLFLIHKAVNYLMVIEQDENSTYADDSCLGEITFVPSTLRELNDIIVPQSKPSEEDDILYLFENGQRIRIHCKELELSVSV
jgi:hypothetical protein